jgi:putative copper resistance protein D
MLMLAAANRWRHTPSFGGALATDGEALALRKLRISLVAEGAAALAILALVAWFGTLEPTGMAV